MSSNRAQPRTCITVAMALLAAASLLVAAPVSAQNLLVNGSFESPVVPTGSFTDFHSGSTGIPGWTVFGDPGKGVSIVSGSFTDRIAFPAQDGAQWLDLTGNGFNSNSQGLAQAVATVPGHQYQLSYYVGNVSDPEQVYGTTSTVYVQINGADAYTDVNSTPNPTTQIWQRFTHTFTATGTATTIGFRNGDTPCTCDQHNGFDNAVLIDLDARQTQSTSTSAPMLSQWAMLALAGALALLGALRRRMHY